MVPRKSGALVDVGPVLNSRFDAIVSALVGNRFDDGASGRVDVPGDRRPTDNRFAPGR